MKPERVKPVTKAQEKIEHIGTTNVASAAHRTEATGSAQEAESVLGISTEKEKVKKKRERKRKKKTNQTITENETEKSEDTPDDRWDMSYVRSEADLINAL